MLNEVCARLACALVLVLAIGSPGRTQLATRDRLVRPVDASVTTLIGGTAHPLARPQFDRGPVSPDKSITGALVFRLSAAQQADLDQLLAAQQKPSSPSYHRWLTPEQYAARFGMSANDLAKVSAWLASQGLTVTGISRGRTELYFSGQAGAVESAFRTEMHTYVVNGTEHFANVSAVSVPQSFAEVVLGVRGLDNFRPKPMSHVRIVNLSAPSPKFTSSISGNHFLNPADFAVIYHVKALYDAGFDGSGVKIAVIGQSQILSTGNATTDVDAFRTASGLPAKGPAAFTLVPSTGTANYNSGDALEADLDLEWSNAVAKNADVSFVYAGHTGSAFDAISYAVNQGLGSYQIISNSFGLCESDIGQSEALNLWQLARQANSQGQTITTASGDSGAADCDGDQSTVPAAASKGLSVDVPAAIPEVTGVGGTEFTGDATQCANATCPVTTSCPNGDAPADGSFWSGTCDLTSPNATAQEYIPEMVWNDTSADKRLSGGGGGASTLFAKPTWQSGSGVPADGVRDVPDVALNASADHDSYLICSQAVFAGSNPPLTSCPNPTTDGFRASDNKTLSTVGGTSAGAPTFAGILALILQATGASGLGNVNPMLYNLAANSPSAFHDISNGNNKVPCVVATKGCPVGTTSIGFTAGVGYDQASGLGSVDASQLETAWLAAIAATPSADFQMEASNSTVAPPQTGNATIIVTATNGFDDTVNFTCSPSSAAASAQVACTLSPTSVVLSSSAKSGSSTLSITTVAALDKPQAPHSLGILFAASGGLFAAVLVGGIPVRRRWYGFLAMVLLVSAIGAVGCGGGSGSGTAQVKAQGTPAGSYAITVTGTGMNTGTSHSVTVTLTVK